MSQQHRNFDNLGGVPFANIPDLGLVRKLGTGFAFFIPTKSAATSPTASDDADAGFTVGSIWVNTTTDVAYICVDDSAGVAVWFAFGSGGGADLAGTVQTTTAASTVIPGVTVATASDTGYKLRAEIVGLRADGGAGIGIEMHGTFRNDSGTVFQIGSTDVVHNPDDSAGTPTATFTFPGSDVRVEVAGIAAETWDWACRLWVLAV